MGPLAAVAPKNLPCLIVHVNIKTNQENPEIRCSYRELRDPATLIPHPRNPNKHGARQIDMLARIIRHQGWRNPIVVSARSGFVVAGHGRLQAALQLGAAEVPVDVQEFATEADEWAHLVAVNERPACVADIEQGLRFEFDLPLPGGKRYGRADEIVGALPWLNDGEGN